VVSSGAGLECQPFLPNLNRLQLPNPTIGFGLKQLYHIIWRGSYPAMVKDPHVAHTWELFYRSYVATYIQRDIRDQLGIQDVTVFLRFMQVAAARSGQLLNFADLARDSAISESRAHSWLNALHASGSIFLLQPYHSTLTKRLVKTPKLYFMDTGLCAYLCGWSSPEVLERGAMSGAILETWAVSEIIKSYLHHGRTPRIYFYRDKEQKEIDVLLEQDGALYPIEIKKTSQVRSADIRAFSALNKLKVPIGQGCVLSLVPQNIAVNDKVEAVSFGVL
jgi:uncharacterized protein